ncbi:hypothetical protein [Candidatus Nanohalobium constans]|uniref:hypothetical protein n=1 Tax=Candidatus Nanohalobium constans TaxID=2565781 RepID=UPI0012983233|nr:hypothetical protein [Candidatus Nanohalobium constans]
MAKVFLTNSMMPYRFTCSVCGREFRAEKKREAVARAKAHFDRQHDRELNREEAEQKIQEE